MGLGPGNSVQRNFLPHPYSDFIFAIIVEEYRAGWGRDRDVALPDYFVPGRGDCAALHEDVPGDFGGRIGAVYRVSGID